MIGVLNRAARLLRIGRGLWSMRRAADPSAQAHAKAALAELFEDARGTTMKIGQLFSEVGGDTPFDNLAKGVEPYPLATMLPVLEAGLSKPVDAVFTHIEERGIAASLGQVHRATLKDGTEVAVKIRYPGIVKAVTSEMRLAGLIPGLGPAKKWGIDLNGYKKTLKANMDRELDYRGEAERQIAFAQNNHVPGLCVPKVYTELSSEAVLVQSWEDGQYLDTVLDWPFEERSAIAHMILSIMLHGLFVSGEMHGDPHMGNSLYRHAPGGDRSPEMVLLDYGCTVSINHTQRESLLELILACRDGGVVPAYAYLCEMGFDAEKLDYIREDLVAICHLLLKPFIGDAPFDPATWGLKEGFDDLLGERRWWLRSSGPPESLLTVRVFHGAIAQLESLGVSLAWWSFLQSALPAAMLGAAENRLAEKRKAIMAEDAQDEEEDRPALASELRVHVTEGTRMVVSMAMPARAAYDLPDIMPGDVIDYIRSSGSIDLDAVMQRINDSQAAPQILFELDREKRHYKVWLL